MKPPSTTALLEPVAVETDAPKTSAAARKALGRALSISVLNQAVSSATNLLFGLYLVRQLTPAEFGIYGISFAVSLFVGGLGYALFLTQMTVNAPDKHPEDRKPYAARIFAALTLGVALLGVLIACAAVVGSVWSTWLAEHTSLCLLTTMISIAYLLKDFFLRHAYVVHRESWALTINIAVAVALGGGIALYRYTSLDFDLESALGLYGVSNIAGAASGHVLARLPLRGLNWSRLWMDVHEAWSNGRWALASMMAYFLRAQSHTLVAAIFIGPAAVGHLNATRLLVTPPVVLIPALAQVAIPRLSELRVQCPGRVARVGIQFSLLMLAIVVVYAIALVLSIGPVTLLVLGERYRGSSALVAGWCAFTALLAVRNGADMILQALKRFRGLMVANIAAAIFSLAAVGILSKIMGLPGAVVGLVMGELVLSIVLWLVIRCSPNIPSERI